MPNWTENDLQIRGCPEEVERLIAFVASEESIFDFSKIIPSPKEFKGVHSGSCTIDGIRCGVWREVDGKAVAIPAEELARWRREYGAVSWYDWNIEHWGTKWNAADPELDQIDGDNVVFHFSTAWSPPMPVVEKLAKLFPELRIKHDFFEMGCGFQGHFTYAGGVVVKHTEGKYHGKRGG